MRGLAILLILSSILISCGKKSRGASAVNTPGHKAGSEQGPEGQVPSETGEWIDWTPANVDLRCAPGQTCPAQVGLLIFVEPPVKGVHATHRCTAFQISQTQIMSNGHCDFLKRGTGYFVTSAGAPGGKQMRKITSVATKVFSPLINPEAEDDDGGRPDLAVFNLDSPIAQPGLQLAGLNDPAYSELIGYGIDKVDKEKYVINVISCPVRRHEAIFPFDFSEKPDVMTMVKCFAKKGNSGGPLLAPGSQKVQAVIQAGQDPNLLAQKVQKKFDRGLFVYENHWSLRASNVRCFNEPAGSCLQATEELSKARFKAMQEREQQRRGNGPLQFNEWAEVISQ